MINFSATLKTTKNTILSASIVALSLLSASSVAQASEQCKSKFGCTPSGYPNEQDEVTSAPTRQKQCEIKANSAESIMRMYQNGTTVKELVQRTDDNAHKLPEKYRDVAVALYKEVIYAAGMTPKFTTAEYRRNAIIEFSNKIMMECMKNGFGM